jgi:RNA polymerase-binding transcription factor DksA
MIRTGDRIRFRRVLREARAQSELALAATTAAFSEREERYFFTLDDRTLEVSEPDWSSVDQESDTLLAIHGLLELLSRNPEHYRECEKCGRPIAPARLLFSPSATRCDQHSEDQVH